MRYVVHAKLFLVLDLNHDVSCIDSIHLPDLSCAGFGSISALWRVPRSAERPAHADHRPRYVATTSDNARGPEEVGGFNGDLDYSKHAKRLYSPV